MKPLVTAALVAANVAVYVAALPFYGFVPASPTVSSALASMFVHDGLVHLVGNMAFLAVAGTVVERELGHLRLLALYVTSGIAGILVHVLVNPASTDALVGASGAVCGLLAVATVLRPRMLPFVVLLVGLNVWYALSGTGGNVSFGCHIGGFAVGAAVALYRSYHLEWRRSWRTSRASVGSQR